MYLWSTTTTCLTQIGQKHEKLVFQNKGHNPRIESVNIQNWHLNSLTLCIYFKWFWVIKWKPEKLIFMCKSMDITPEQTKCEITKSNFTCLYNENLSSRSQWESDIWTCVLMLPNPLPHTPQPPLCLMPSGVDITTSFMLNKTLSCSLH